MTIQEHLLRYDIYPYQSQADLDARCAAEMSSQELKKHNMLYDRTKRSGRLEDERRYSDFKSEPRICANVTSTAANGICEWGLRVAAEVAGAAHILDVGCSWGYLTTWYAMQNPAAEVVGIDISKRTTDAARLKTDELGIPNIRYVPGDFEKFEDAGLFNAIIATSFTGRPLMLFLTALRLLADDGKLVTTTYCDNAATAKEYLRILCATALSVDKVKLISVTDVGDPDIYLMFVATKKARPSLPDIDALYAKISGSRTT